MNKISNQSNLSKTLNEANNNVMSQYDLQYSINELASILRKAPVIDRKIVHTAESVPVFIMGKDDGSKAFIIEQEELVKLMDSQHIEVGDALRHIKESLEENLDDAIEFNSFDFNIANFAVVFTKEDIDALSCACMEDPCKIDARCEAVTSHTGFMNKILAEGAQIILKDN